MNNTTTPFSVVRDRQVWGTVPLGWLAHLSATEEVIFAVLALVGNGLFIGTFILKRDIRTRGNALLVNLSVTDVVAAALVSVPSSVSFYLKRWALGHNFCAVHFLLHGVLVGASLWTTAFIALNRYIYVVHNDTYRRVTTRLTISLCIACTWLFPSLTRMYVDDFRFNLHAYRFSLAALRCVGRGGGQSPHFALVNVYLPSLVVICCYAAIAVYVRRSRMRVQAHAPTQTHQKKQEYRMLLVIFGVFLMILLGYVPFQLVLTICRTRNIPLPVNGLMALYPCMHLGGVLNPVLYGVNNKRFRKAYREVLAIKLDSFAIRCRNPTQANVQEIVIETGDSNV